MFCLYSKPVRMPSRNPLRRAEWKWRPVQLFSLAQTRMQTTFSFTYANLRYITRSFHCHDPRDKFHAALSLLNSEDNNLQVQPDYSQDIERVFVDIARRKLERQHTLDLLRACELSTKTLGVPPWVPDWSSRSMYLKSPILPWSACSFVSAQASLDINNLRCIVSGVLVAEVTDVVEHTVDEDSGNVTDNAPLFEAIKPTEEELRSQYLTGKNRVEAYCHTFVAGRTYYLWPNYPRLDHGIRYLKHVWRIAPIPSWSKLLTMTSNFFTYVSSSLIGRCFFRTSKGHIGLAHKSRRCCLHSSGDRMSSRSTTSGRSMLRAWINGWRDLLS